MLVAPAGRSPPGPASPTSAHADACRTPRCARFKSRPWWVAAQGVLAGENLHVRLCFAAMEFPDMSLHYLIISLMQCGGGESQLCGGRGRLGGSSPSYYDEDRETPMTDPNESEVDGLTEVTVPANIEQEDLTRHVRALYALVGLLYRGRSSPGTGNP